MADQSPPTVGHNRGELPPVLFGMLAILVVVVVVATLYFAREIFVPIVLAVLLTFLLAPAVRRLRRMGVGRGSAVTITLFIALLALFGFAAIMVQEVSSLARELPNYQYNLQTKIRSLPGIVPGGGVFHRATDMLRDLRNELAKSDPQGSSPLGAGANPNASGDATKPIPVQIREPEPQPLQIVQSIVGPLLQPLATGGLAVVFVILILLDREDLRDRLLRLAGRGDLQRTTEAMDDAARRISRYLRWQLIVNACVGLPIGVGLAVIGIPNAALWGIMTVILRFVPYLGIVIAATFPLALAIAVDPGWSLLVWTGLLFLAIELVVANIVEPWLYGGSTGISPVALIAAATFWTWLWGPLGLLLSTPMTVCLVVLGRHVPQLQFLDVMLGNEPVLSPEETFYQRMLANDPEEATQQAEEFAEEHSLIEFFDMVALPALARAQADSDRGALPPERRRVLTDAFRVMLENLSDIDIGDGSLTDEQPAGQEAAEDRPKIVCVAGRNELDEIACCCLMHLLRQQSHSQEVQALSADALLANNLYLLPLRSAAFVCLSLVSTSSPARARYLVRRVRRRASRAKVMVGLWGLATGNISEAETEAASADLVATSFSQAMQEMQSILSVGTMAAHGPLTQGTLTSQGGRGALPS